MKKRLQIIMGLVLFIVLAVGSSWATPTVYNNPNTYTSPAGYHRIASRSTIDLDHSYYYEWAISDLNNVNPSNLSGQVDIVFHGIHDWAIEPDRLSVYVRDGISGDIAGNWTQGIDWQDPTMPVYPSATWTFIGDWSDPAGGRPWHNPPTYDVVYSLIIDSTWQNYLTNNGTFVIGIDPDCHYYGDEISVYSPVPEPATMLLLGMGLVGLVAGRRRKNNLWRFAKRVV